MESLHSLTELWPFPVSNVVVVFSFYVVVGFLSSTCRNPNFGVMMKVVTLFLATFYSGHSMDG